jgi:hypothetical protein
MDHIHRAMGDPALTQLRMEPVNFKLTEDSLAPSRLPDLFADRPVTVFGRFVGDATSIELRILGRDVAGNPWQQQIAACPRTASAVLALWGRARVRELEDRYAAGAKDPEALAHQIVEVSLASHVLSRFTAYVAVDRAEVVNPQGKQHKIIQPVEIPSGWDASTTLFGFGGTAMACRSASVMAFACEPHAKMRSLKKQKVRGFPLDRRSPAPAAPRTIAAIIDDLRKVLKKAPSRWIRRQTLIGHLVRLVQFLGELALMLRQTNNPAAQAVEELATRGQEILDQAAAGKDGALDRVRVGEYFAAVAAMLDTLAGAPQHVPSRETFWK